MAARTRTRLRSAPGPALPPQGYVAMFLQARGWTYARQWDMKGPDEGSPIVKAEQVRAGALRAKEIGVR